MSVLELCGRPILDEDPENPPKCALIRDHVDPECTSRPSSVLRHTKPSICSGCGMPTSVGAPKGCEGIGTALAFSAGHVLVDLCRPCLGKLVAEIAREGLLPRSVATEIRRAGL